MKHRWGDKTETPLLHTLTDTYELAIREASILANMPGSADASIRWLVNIGSMPARDS